MQLIWGRVNRLPLLAALMLMVGLGIGYPSAAGAAVVHKPQTVAVAAKACGNYAARTAYVTYGSQQWGLVQVSYSSCTRMAWAYLTSYLSGCIASYQSNCGTATLYRNDGAHVACSFADRATSCNSPQISDANYTSYAYGSIYVYPVGYGVGQTGSY